MTTKRETIGAVVAAVAAVGGWTMAQMVGPARRTDLNRHRQIAMWLAHRRTGAAASAIGRALMRDHTTVLWGIRQCERRIPSCPDLQAFVDRVILRLEGHGVATEPTSPPPDLDARTDVQKARDEAKRRLAEEGGQPASAVFLDRSLKAESRGFYIAQNERFAAAMRAALTEEQAA